MAKPCCREILLVFAPYRFVLVPDLLMTRLRQMFFCASKPITCVTNTVRVMAVMAE
jgi:hypothetical protein